MVSPEQIHIEKLKKMIASEGLKHRDSNIGFKISEAPSPESAH